MMSTHKKAFLEKRLARLLETYNAANRQLIATHNYADRIVIEDQIENIEIEIRKVEAKLAYIEHADANPNNRHLSFQTHFPKIDFEHIDKSLQHIVDQLGREGTVALFLLQNSLEMGGKWCIARMRERLKSNAGEFREYPVEFSPAAGTPDKHIILDSLARHFDVEADREDLNRYAQELIKWMCESIPPGGVFFIEMRRWDYIQSQDEVLTWFIESFWNPLLQKWPEVLKKKRKARLIFVIITDSEINSEGLSSLLCHAEDQYSSEKIFNLTLRHWTKNDIRDWLDTFSVSFTKQRLFADQIDNIADYVYRASKNGMPALVHETLWDHFCKEG